MRISEENQFLIPSAGSTENRYKRPTWPGFLFTLLLAVGVFGVSTGAARFFFPRGADGRQGGGSGLESLVIRDDDGYKTWECAANLTGDPVMSGADVVSYFSLSEGQGAMFGTEEHSSDFNGYLFYFVSEENKDVFEADPLSYMPAWGGFCAYGIAQEDWWTRFNLGPDADPNSWLITEGGSLHFFRSEYPKSRFMGDIPGNIELGNAIWTSWWGDDEPAGAGAGSPLNTACFCTVTTCFDQ